MDSRHDHQPDDDDDAPLMPTEAELKATMDQSDADVAAGRTVPLTDVLADLDAAIERMKARRRARRA